MNQKEFGQFIATLRKGKKLTQEQLGEKLGVNSRTISRWENGNYMPDISLFEDLGRELDVSVLELLKCKKIDSDNYVEESNKNTVEILIREKKDKRKVFIILFIFFIILLLLSLFSLKQTLWIIGTREDTDRCCNFIDGIYTNDVGVEINQEEYNILSSIYPYIEIESVTRETIDLAINDYYATLEGYSWYGEVVFLGEKIDEVDGIIVTKQMGSRLPFVSGNYEVEIDKKYCYLGLSKYGTFILSKYEDNKCIITDIECERLKSDGAISKIDINKYCKVD